MQDEVIEDNNQFRSIYFYSNQQSKSHLPGNKTPGDGYV